MKTLLLIVFALTLASCGSLKLVPIGSSETPRNDTGGAGVSYETKF